MLRNQANINIFRSIALLSLAVFFAVDVSAQLNCDITGGSCSGQNLFQLYSLSGSHASSDNSYNYKVCCETASVSLSNQCSGIYDVVLRLSAQSNAHAEKDSQSNYPIDICLATSYPAGSVDCDYSASCSDLGATYSCLASISKDTNAQLGDCNAYTTKICCAVDCEATETDCSDGIDNDCDELLDKDDDDCNTPPTHSTPLLSSTYGTNYTYEDLTCYNQSTYDVDGDLVINIIKWYKNGAEQTSLENLSTITSDNTAIGDNWFCSITPSDLIDYGETKSSNELIIRPSIHNMLSCTTITQPGIYYLTQNIVDSSAIVCMNISANDVILDCQGNMIDGISSESSYAIYASRQSSQKTNITVENCVVTDWGVGLFFFNNNDNLIYNNYLNNTYNTYDNGGNNWNTTRDCAQTNIIGGNCIGGNFYSDYVGVDKDGDGIGELVYNILANNIDYLPLAQPCDDSDNDGVCDEKENCVGQNQTNIPNNNSCTVYYGFNYQSGCWLVYYNSSYTVLNTTQCPDELCVVYPDVDTTCDGEGGIIYRDCSDSTPYNKSVETPCGWSTAYRCSGAELGSNVLKQENISQCDGAGNCIENMVGWDWLLEMDCEGYEYCYYDGVEANCTCDDNDNDGICDPIEPEDCRDENLLNLPQDTLCADWEFNSSGCHDPTYAPAGTTIAAFNCPTDSCINYTNNRTICGANGAIINGSCDDYVWLCAGDPDNSITACAFNFSKGIDEIVCRNFGDYNCWDNDIAPDSDKDIACCGDDVTDTYQECWVDDTNNSGCCWSSKYNKVVYITEPDDSGAFCNAIGNKKFGFNPGGCNEIGERYCYATALPGISQDPNCCCCGDDPGETWNVFTTSGLLRDVIVSGKCKNGEWVERAKITSTLYDIWTYITP